MRAAFVPVVALSGLVAACFSPPRPPEPQLPVLRVRVIDSVAGRPVAHAPVRALPASKTVSTDLSGDASLRPTTSLVQLQVGCPTSTGAFGPVIRRLQIILDESTVDTQVVLRVSTRGCATAVAAAPTLQGSAVGMAEPRWRKQLMAWPTSEDDAHQWRTDPRLSRFGRYRDPDDFLVTFDVADTSDSPSEALWVRTIAYDAATDLYLGVLLNRPSLIRDLGQGDNVVYHAVRMSKGLHAVQVSGSFIQAGWPATAAPQYLAALERGIRAYRVGDNGRNMTSIDECIAALTPAMSALQPTARRDEVFTGHFVLGRCLAERDKSVPAIRELRAAIGIEPMDLDSHMALLAELSAMTHPKPGALPALDAAQWEKEFVDELALVRARFAQDPDVQRTLTSIFTPDEDSRSPSETARLRRVGYRTFRWRRR